MKKIILEILLWLSTLKIILEILWWLFAFMILCFFLTWLFMPLTENRTYYESHNGYHMKIITKDTFTRGSAVAQGYDDNGDMVNCAVILGTTDIRRLTHAQIVNGARGLCKS